MGGVTYCQRRIDNPTGRSISVPIASVSLPCVCILNEADLLGHKGVHTVAIRETSAREPPYSPRLSRFRFPLRIRWFSAVLFSPGHSRPLVRREHVRARTKTVARDAKGEPKRSCSSQNEQQRLYPTDDRANTATSPPAKKRRMVNCRPGHPFPRVFAVNCSLSRQPPGLKLTSNDGNIFS